jgi:hypothetical protein
VFAVRFCGFGLGVSILPPQPGIPVFREIRSSDEKCPSNAGFLIIDILYRPVFKLFGPEIPKSLQPNPEKLPFSGDSPWRLKNKYNG